jgi:putative transposase
MNKRDHLRRLDAGYYRGNALVHWTLTMRDRKQGWLNAMFLYRFRELLTHSAFRYGIASPVFCLMPDHIHMLWMGLFEFTDQLTAMKHFRKSLNESLSRIEYELQDQAYDHVLRDEERQEQAFQHVCEYIARNPERAGLVDIDGYKNYAYTGCLVPGYPQLRPFEDSFWNEFGRVISYIRANGLLRRPKP